MTQTQTIEQTTFAFKQINGGRIIQTRTRPTIERLFKAAGLGAVSMDKPVNGFIAVEVEKVNGIFVEKA